MNKNKICWVTADYYIDSNLSIISLINETYHLNWIIVNSKRGVSDHDELIKRYIKNANVKPFIFNLKNKFGNPRIIIEYLKLFMFIRKTNSDIIYLNISGFPYFLLLAFLFFNRNKMIYAAHNVSTLKGYMHEWQEDFYQKTVLKLMKNIHVFSKNQKDILLQRYGTTKNILLAPIAMTDFGAPKVQNDDRSGIVFLFFGHIRRYKRVDILIEAANNLSEHTKIKFKIIIAGSCSNWEDYHKLIRHPDKFELIIKIISDEEIPDLFGRSHYVVLPYQDATQSGILTIAYNFNIPAIASRIKSFEENIIDDETGYLFDKNSVNDLERILMNVLSEHKERYFHMKSKLKKYVDSTLSVKSIFSEYQNYLNTLLYLKK